MGKKRAKRDTYLYELKDGRKTVYIGITDDPKRREQEHRDEGKKFTKTNVNFPCSKDTAIEREQERIEQYKRSHRGKKPREHD